MSFDVRFRQGSSILVCGPSGSGKTSLLRIMSGIQEATSGNILWYGKPIELLPKPFCTYVRSLNI